MELTYKIEKLAAAVIGHKNSVVGHFMNGKCGRFAKTIFYVLQASKYHWCRVRITDKAVNQGDGIAMKIACILIFIGRSEVLDVLSQELKKHL